MFKTMLCYFIAYKSIGCEYQNKQKLGHKSLLKYNIKNVECGALSDNRMEIFLNIVQGVMLGDFIVSIKQSCSHIITDVLGILKCIQILFHGL